MGNVAVARVFVDKDGGDEIDERKEKCRKLGVEDNICVVSNAGQSVGRLARREFISGGIGSGGKYRIWGGWNDWGSRWFNSVNCH